MKMKEGETARGVMMWVVMMIVLVQALVSFAAQEEKKNNDNSTNNSYIGIIEKDDFESEELFPDAISCEIHRRVLQQGGGTKTQGTLDGNEPAFNAPGNRYAQDYNGPSPGNPNGAPGCRDPYNRAC